jgi:dienelactone hydrolase
MKGHSLPESVLLKMESKPSPGDNWIMQLFIKAWNMATVIPSMFGIFYYCRPGTTIPRLTSFLRAVRSTTPNGGPPPKVGVAGFCWGGLYAVLMTHDTPENHATIDGTEYPLIDCAFSAHPAMLKIPEYIEAAVQPLSVANGDNDEWMGEHKMRLLVATLEAKNERLGKEVHEAVVYPGAVHGFAVRGDRNDPLQKERGDQSEDQAVSWFRRHFQEAN